MTLGVPSGSILRPDWAKQKYPDPLPLTRELAPPSPFPAQALGSIGSSVVNKMHQVIQAPVALIGQITDCP